MSMLNIPNLPPRAQQQERQRQRRDERRARLQQQQQQDAHKDSIDSSAINVETPQPTSLTQYGDVEMDSTSSPTSSSDSCQPSERRWEC